MSTDEPDDVIPGFNDGSTTTATATADDDVPFGRPEDEADRFTINFMTVDESVDAIEKQRSREVPFGEQTLEVLSVTPQPEPRTIMSYVKNRQDIVERVDYTALSAQVKFCVPGDEKCTISAFFVLPPSGDRAQDSYKRGFWSADDAEKSSPKEGGRNYREFVQFVSRLGFKQDANNNLPAAAFQAKNWLYYPNTKIRRRIGCKVVPGKPKTAKADGQSVAPARVWNQIDRFSYFEVPPPPEAAIAAYGGTASQNTQAAPAAPAAAEQPAKAPAKKRAAV